MEALLRRVREVAEATGNEQQKQSITGDGEKVDKFTLLKREINLEIREVRNAIKERDRFSESRGAKNDQAEIVRMSTLIRSQIVELRKKEDQLKALIGKPKKGEEEKVANREKMAQLIHAHIDECERWFKGMKFVSAKDDPNKRALLKGANFNENADPKLVDVIPGDPTETELEDIDGIAEWQMQVNANEDMIDEQLDQLVDATQAIKHLSIQIRDEYSILGTMTDDVQKKMDKSGENLEDANKQLEKTAKKVNAKANCCLDITLILLLIACVGFIIWKYAT